ncbi:tRNA pseudouridine synthase D [Nitrococcus mobilis Nb-231]|uniref:tRNA pseudouridine synthase D n=1 Tax=Nitrococcus mobilis Nb-231 TaxID=314278 RepID=A4BQ32_9GAMM|nr:tRNA pseudouridine synthase D [Nitrococcus mobilis Nb-231]
MGIGLNSVDHKPANDLLTRVLPAHGPPLGRAWLKSVAEDFQVTEIPRFQPDGQGEHLLVEIRKRGLTTAEAVERLAGLLGVAPRAVGHAGRKDRNAVTTQWLSVHQPGGRQLPVPGAIAPGLEILSAARHSRKLRVGALAGNRFQIRLRGIDVPRAAADRRLLRIVHHGVPNYFGRQRFGRGGENVAKALAWQRGELTIRRRDLQGLLLSAVRAECFNRVLRHRVETGTWDRALTGDWMILDGRGSVFAAADETPARLAQRLALQTIHPTGPLPGVGKPLVTDKAQRLEQAVLDEVPELTALLIRRKVSAQRRSLRLRVAELAWWWPATSELIVGFRLPPGAYATTVLGECFELIEAAGVD